VTPILDEELYRISPNVQTSRTLPPFTSQKDPPHTEATKSLPTITRDEATKINKAAPALSEVSPYKSKPSNMLQANESSGGVKRWYR
jgi:hypothetical protein